MFGHGAAPLPMFGWWCNLPDCLCGDSRLGCPSSEARSLVLVARAKSLTDVWVYRPRIRRHRFVSKTTASLRIRRFASFHISACFLSYQASASVSSSSHRFVSKIIAPLRKPASFRIRYRSRCRKLPRTQKPFRAEPCTFSTPSCDIQPCPRNSNQQS